ncbi:hypothetical protein DFS34DRAFT_576643 [Phlyctochytrium arcticum]|nr:hypothetical protein DFS34DRAFT_576643 [Phlyctochytrium arcticum]
MGVKSLWRLLEPAAKPRRVETLAGQKLAIDASIWLHQFLKAMRDKEGNLIKGAHIVGFYRRICKLLYFGIRPVFIFDGDTPAMKRVALTERRQRKTTAKNNLAKTAHKILYKRLQLEALQRNENANLARGHNVPEVGSLLPKKIAAKSDPFLSKKRKERLDEYELPEEIANLAFSSYIAEDPRLISKDEMISFVDHYKDDINLNDLNLDDQRFKELPIEMQHDIVTEVKTKSRLANHRRLATMINAAPDALKFSALQIKHLVNRNNLTERLQHLSKNANAQRPRRVASERNREYMLVKNEDTGGHTLKLLAQYGGKGAGTGGLNGQKASSSNEVIDLASDDNDEARGEDWLHLLRMHGQGHHAKKLDADAPSSPSTSAAIPGSSSQKRRAYTRKTQIPTEKSSDMSNSVTDDRTSKDVITSSHSHSEVNDLSDDDEEFEEIPPAPQSTLSAVDGHREKSSLLIDQDAYVPDALSTEQIMEIAEFGPCTPPRDRSSVQRLNAEKTTVPLEEPLIDIPIPQTPSRRKETLPHTPSPFKRAINATANMLGFASDDSGNSDDDEEFEVVNSIDTSQSQNGSFEQVETPVGLPTPKSISIIRKEGGEGHSKSVVDLQNEIGASVLSTLTSLKPPQTPATIETQEPREMPPDHDADAHFDDFIPATTAMDENEAQIDVPDIPMEEEEEFARFVSSLSNQTREDVEKRLETEMVSLNKKKRAEEAGAVDIEGELIRDIQSLLTIFGLPYLVAPMEAESQCAWLVTAKLVDGIVTDDSDVFLFGGTRIYKNMFNQQKYVEEYTAERLYETMNLTRENLIQLAYLLGSDYTEGIEGVGPTGAMEVLAEWGGEGLEPLERFREWWEGVLRNPTAIVSTENATLRRLRRLCSKLSIPASFPDSRVCDAYLHPMLNEDPTAFTWGTPDLDALRDFMEYKLHWPQHTVDSVMIPLLREMERNLTTRSEQSRLDDFFSVESRRKEAEDETEDNEKRLAMARLKNSERVKKGVATLKRSRKRGGGVGTSGAPPTATTNGTQGATDAGVGGSGPSAKPTRGRRASTRGGRGKKRGS